MFIIKSLPFLSKPKNPPAPQRLNTKITVTLASKDIEVLVRYSIKAKQIRLYINHVGKPTLVIPRRKSLEQAKEFLYGNIPWLSKAMEKIKRVEDSNEQIPILGIFHTITHIESNRKLVHIEPGRISVSSPIALQRATLIKHLKKLCLNTLTQMVKEISYSHHFSVKNTRISNSKTRWGSCSSKGKISFSWRLIFAPAEVARYVVVHELCHLKEMNHSQRFWKLVKEIDPDFREHRLWLKENSILLHKFCEV